MCISLFSIICMCLSEKLVFERLLRAIEDNVKLPQCTHAHTHKYTQPTCVNPDYSRHGSMLMGTRITLPGWLSEPPWSVGCCQPKGVPDRNADANLSQKHHSWSDEMCYEVSVKVSPGRRAKWQLAGMR